MQVPDISKFSTYQDFLSGFIEENKRNRQLFSHRYLAKKLGWPSSYLSDVIKRRKSFSLAKAIEFAQFAQLDPYDTEYLVLLVLKDERHDSVKQFAAKKLQEGHDRKTREVGSSKRALFKQAELLAIYEYLNMAGEMPDEHRLSKLLYTFPNLAPDRILRIIAALESNGLVRRRRGSKKLEITSEGLFLDDANNNSPFEIHRNFSQSFLEYCNNPEHFPRSLNGGYVTLQLKDFERVRGKVLAFRNWLHSQSLKAKRELGKRPEAANVFQYEVNLIPILATDPGSKDDQ